MPEITLPATGRCQCGALTFEITAPPFATSACHCRDCQRMTGSAFSLTVMTPAEGFRVTGGEAVRGGLGTGHRHMHCAKCLSWVFTQPQGVDFLVNVRTPMLDAPPTEVPFMETKLSDAMPFARLGAPHGFDDFPTGDDIPGLIEDYAKTRN
ncbi:GFA family protein [Psychromarinibacter halotolerans]|uniref:GFA family protein n=1 Tax=Psychromarinibacter halotolerans TaxID=1775175 RepID=A0ABV7GW83_9RHOB|nr:GFA family protein [Psychromarinibacter halotolerans]MDF0595102.1 GFA family protein [Psychromarinibacter halotolerans]